MKKFEMSKFGLDFEIIINEPKVIAILRVVGKEFKGFSNCSPEDTFNKRLGILIAVKRAVDQYTGNEITYYKRKVIAWETKSQNIRQVMDTLIDEQFQKVNQEEKEITSDTLY
jgi:hypothetical protein